MKNKYIKDFTANSSLGDVTAYKDHFASVIDVRSKAGGTAVATYLFKFRLLHDPKK